MEQPHRMAIAIWDIESGVAVSFIANADFLFEKGFLFCLTYSIGEEIEFSLTLKLYF